MMELDLSYVSENRQRHLVVGEVGVDVKAFHHQFLSLLVHVFRDLVARLLHSSVVSDNTDNKEQ
jgi:hypothetical protein